MVEVLTSEVVIPAEETPGGAIWLANLDLAALRCYTPTVSFFRSNGEPGFFAADAMKDSLAAALVAFYPLAGRLGVDGSGRVQVDCTGEGVVFVTARSDYVLDNQTEEFVPCDGMRSLFVPPTPAPDPPCALLFVQVTYLRCGGVVLGQAMHHSVVDGRGAAHFYETWASIARGGGATVNVRPCFDRTPLSARPARAVLYDHPEYKPEAEPVDAVAAASTYASAVFTMTKGQVDALKVRCAGESTFRAAAALVWQCVCRARALPSETETRLYSMVDVRARLEPPLPPGYFGNAVVRTSVSATVGEVVSNPVGHAARRVREATSQADGYARSLVDYLEGVDMTNPLPWSGISPVHLLAISWMGMSLPDFGWGTPVFKAPAVMYHKALVYVMNVPGKYGAVALVLSLEPESMPEFKKVFAEEVARLELLRSRV